MILGIVHRQGITLLLCIWEQRYRLLNSQRQHRLQQILVGLCFMPWTVALCVCLHIVTDIHELH